MHNSEPRYLYCKWYWLLLCFKLLAHWNCLVIYCNHVCRIFCYYVCHVFTFLCCIGHSNIFHIFYFDETFHLNVAGSLNWLLQIFRYQCPIITLLLRANHWAVITDNKNSAVLSWCFVKQLADPPCIHEDNSFHSLFMICSPNHHWPNRHDYCDLPSQLTIYNILIWYQIRPIS
jgi:hypothetical protein